MKFRLRFHGFQEPEQLWRFSSANFSDPFPFFIGGSLFFFWISGKMTVGFWVCVSFFGELSDAPDCD